MRFLACPDTMETQTKSRELFVVSIESPWSGFPAPERLLTGPVEGDLIVLNSSEWSVQVCPDLKWENSGQHLF